MNKTCGAEAVEGYVSLTRMGTLRRCLLTAILSKRNTRAITQTKDGDMWIGTRDHGIIHLRRERERLPVYEQRKKPDDVY